FDLTGKTALVTGASGGIGGAIATALYRAGATVGLTGTRVEALNAVRDTLGERAHVLPANLRDDGAAEALIADAQSAMGGLHILINNAGVTRDGLLMRMKDEDWNTVIEVNLTVAFRLTRAAIKPMMKQRFGRIVGITSVVGVTGNPGQANYAASKAGMIGFTKATAQEVASRGITANCIAPGFIETPMTDALNDTQRGAIMTTIPAGRLGAPIEVAAAAVYLASDEAAYMTGQTLHVNGGMAML
ncbi:MAG: 3-oxoacyl-[acyl-carrier-protein] reductase, partial [Pseudomonadota bacterium]